jgi:hypothetical protein
MYFIRDYNGPELYQPGDNPDVMVLGQDPTIDQTTRFSIALGLGTSKSSPGRESPRLKNYLFNKILSPLGIDSSRIMATNLVNAYYFDVPNSKIAPRYRIIIITAAKENGIDIEKYPDTTNGAILHALNFELGTRRNFEELLNLSSIKHLITLGEPVFQVLRERYRLDLPSKIKPVLESINERPPIVHIGGKQVSILPLPHIFIESNQKWQFYNNFLRKGLIRLSKWYAEPY